MCGLLSSMWQNNYMGKIPPELLTVRVSENIIQDYMFHHRRPTSAKMCSVTKLGIIPENFGLQYIPISLNPIK